MVTFARIIGADKALPIKVPELLTNQRFSWYCPCRFSYRPGGNLCDLVNRGGKVWIIGADRTLPIKVRFPFLRDKALPIVVGGFVNKPSHYG